MLKDKYKAYEIRGEQVKETVVEGTLLSIADFILNCHDGSIIMINSLDGKPFLLGLSKLFLYCEDKEFLEAQLIPYLRKM